MSVNAALHALGQVRALPLGGALASYLLGACAVGLRLRAAARAARLDLACASTTAIGLSGVLASHLAFGGAAGELARVAWLTRAGQGRSDAGRRALAALAVDRLADGLAISGLVVCTLAARAAMLLALIPVALAALALFVLPRLAPLLELRRLLTGVLAALPAAFGVWALDLARLYFVGLALGAAWSLPALAAIALAALLGGQAPTPGGLGAVEGAMLAAGAALGLPTGSVVSLIVLDRAISLGLGTALGALASACLVRYPARRAA